MTTQLLEQHKSTSTMIRTGDFLIHTTVTTTVEPVHVDFDDILSAVEVSPDEGMYGETPWHNCDGYDHSIQRVFQIDEGCDSIDQRRGYCYSNVDEERIVITAEWDDDYDYRWYRGHGASRQVAREMVALSTRRRLDQLVKWHKGGWEWWYCGGELKGFRDGGGGIDDYVYAYNEVRRECAENIAYQMEQAGYIVVNRPTVEPADTRQMKRNRFRSNLNLFSWKD